MKKLLFVAGLFIATTNSFAALESQSLNLAPFTLTSVNAVPPPAVLSSFHAIFGNPVVREWKKRSNGQWRVHFIKNGLNWEATFTSTGALVKSEPA